jgi:asparagine synthetase B (glutamine-hydrolysing)
VQRRYLIDVGQEHRETPHPWASESYKVGAFTVSILSPDGPATRDWSCAPAEDGFSLTITDGSPIAIPGDTRPLQSGIYNRVAIDSRARCMTVANDAIGMLPCYFIQLGDRTLVANSVCLARDYAGLGLDELGLAQHYLFGYGIAERTIARDLRWLAPGSLLSLDLTGRCPPSQTRLTTTWTTTIDDSVENIVAHFVELWTAAIEHAFGGLNEPISLMLSGGLDSRMVAGALTAIGKSGVWLNHGNAHSDEARLAGVVAALCHKRLLHNNLDDDFPLERLSLAQTSRRVEALANPIWDSSARLLAENGVAHFTTGAGFDEVLGGYKDIDQRRRLLGNLKQATMGPVTTRRATESELRSLADEIVAVARKRRRNFAGFLVEPYRSMIAAGIEPIAGEVLGRLAAIAATTETSAQQVFERFTFEHTLRQWTAAQERQLRVYGQVHVPTYDRDLIEYISNLPSSVKTDHYLYYRVFRRLYPELARIPVTNLGAPLYRSQLAIEFARARRIIGRRRLSSWINFDQWVRGGDRLSQYEQLFLDNAHFFDRGAMEAHFVRVRDGGALVYDGNELNNFLNVDLMLRSEPVIDLWKGKI